MPTIDIGIDPSVFNSIYVPFLEQNNRIQIYFGGASSGKSVFVAQKKVYQHLMYPGEQMPRKTLVVRKVHNTVRHSAFAEISNVIKQWGLNEKVFRIIPSKLEIHRVDGRSSFICAGLDDVDRLKSIQGVTDVWLEEATETSEDDIKQLNLRLRGKRDLPKEFVLTYNPISALHHLKRNFHDRKHGNVSILKTTYKDNKFLDDEDRSEIEKLKEQDPVFYKIYGLGDWGILGNLVYTNYVIDDFDRKALFDYRHMRYGADWGFNHPSCILEVAYKDDEIFICDGIYAKGLTNMELINEAKCWLKHRKVGDVRIVADSSEPDRILEFKRAGFSIVGAEKGKDSIKFGIDFLRRKKRHIHSSMQDYINEIQSYSYRKDRDGNVLDEPVDMNNHYMDAERYAFERDSKREFGVSFKELTKAREPSLTAGIMTEEF